jgi:3-deoxy-D-manno-octulosonic-acid transferase
MIFWVYNLLVVLLAPVWVPWMLWRAAKRNERPDWRQRTGDLPLEAPKQGERRAWVHAVSVGEVVAALPVLRELRRLDPTLQIVLSTTTSSGQATARERAEGLYDRLVYFPIDVPRFVVAALMRVRPKVVVLMESELWMNFLWAAKQFGARTILLNGRVSDRSFPRSMRVGPYYRALFANLDEALVQTALDAERFQALGFGSPQVVGNTKFDAALADAGAPRDWRAELGIPQGAFLVVVGSTRSEAEEALVTAALASLPEAWVVHAPRHIERAPELLQRYGALGGAVLRSQGGEGQRTILDTYGELAGVYGAADVVVVGGGFDDLGGQNIIQPLAHGKPVLHGPHMQNFRDVTEAALSVGASRAVATASELAEALLELRSDTTARERMGRAARQLVEANLGAARRGAELVVQAARSG